MKPKSSVSVLEHFSAHNQTVSWFIVWNNQLFPLNECFWIYRLITLSVFIIPIYQLNLIKDLLSLLKFQNG